MDSKPIVITNEQFEQIRTYLDEDCQTHLAVHRKWRLDVGKLLTALRKRRDFRQSTARFRRLFIELSTVWKPIGEILLTTGQA